MENNEYVPSELMSKGYGVIPVKVMTDKELPLIAKVIYAYIASFGGSGLDNNDEIAQNILNDLGITMEVFKSGVSILAERGYVK